MRSDRRTLALTLTAAAALGLSACAGSSAETTASAAAPTAAASADASQDPASGASQEAAPVTEGAYIDYAAYQVDPGAVSGDVVLFFHATWCPSCRAADASLTGDGVPAGLTVVKVDYDTETDLRKKHGITQQHTFVAVNPAGDQLSKWSGSVTGEEIKAKANA